MNRHPNAPYRQQWHLPRLKAKLEHRDVQGYFLCAMQEALGSTSRMRRKRLHHIMMDEALKIAVKESAKMFFSGLMTLPREGGPIQGVLDGMPPYVKGGDVQ